MRDRLRHLGVAPGDRVGICCPKSIDTVGAIFGALKCGAAYVPTDPFAPASRNAYIFSDCQVKVVIVEEKLASSLKAELQKLGATPPMFVVAESGDGAALTAALDASQANAPAA